MAMKTKEQMKKDNLMKQADKELRSFKKEDVLDVMNWWGKWRVSVGWRRLARVMTTYAKELQKNNNNNNLNDVDNDETERD